MSNFVIRRVVIVTPDLRQIDRRVLLEAQTLRASGKEVIIIASNDGQQPEYEIRDGIKIFRPVFNFIDMRFVWLIATTNKILNGIQRGSIIFNQIANGTALGVTRFFNALSLLANVFWARLALVITRMLGWISQGCYCLIKSLSLGGYYTVRWLAIAGNQIFRGAIKIINWKSQLLLRFLQAVTGKNAYEHFLEEKISYFRPDVVHVFDLPVLKGAVLAARRKKAYCIYDSRELYVEQEFPQYLKWMLARKERSCVKHVHWTITVNHFIAEELRRRYNLRRVEVIENSLNRPPGFDPERQRYNLFREEYRLPAQARLLLYQGWIAPPRNLNTLVKGMRYLEEDYYLLMMGYGEYIEELKKLAVESGVGHRVIFVPTKSQAELLYYTASADVGVMPYSGHVNLNTRYSSPNKMYEYIAAGLPLLANQLPYYEEIVARYRNGLVADLNTPERFAQAVQQLSTLNWEELRRNSLAAYHELKWDIQARKLLAIYDRLEQKGNNSL